MFILATRLTGFSVRNNNSLAQLIVLFTYIMKVPGSNCGRKFHYLTEIYRDFLYLSGIDKAPAVPATLEAVGFRGPIRTKFCRA